MSEEIVVYERTGLFDNEWIVRWSSFDYLENNVRVSYVGPALDRKTLIALAKVAGVTRLWDFRTLYGFKAATGAGAETEYNWSQP